MSDVPPADRMDDESPARGLPSSSQDEVPEGARRSIERWFVARGVPQLIEGYRSEPRMDARAVPLIGAWLVVAAAIVWLVRPEVSFVGRSLE